MILDIITPVESDVFLSFRDDWLELSTTAKIQHINEASVYTQTVWVCASVVWGDGATVSDTIKRAVALYAYASFKGTLYGDISEGAVNSGKIVSLTEKVGLISSSKKYSESIPFIKNPLSYPDSLMMSECTKSSATGLVRS